MFSKFVMAVAVLAVSVRAQGPPVEPLGDSMPLAGGDKAGNLVLNASDGTVLVNGKDLVEMMNMAAKLSKTVELLRTELQDHIFNSSEGLNVEYNNKTYFAGGESFTITGGVRAVQKLAVFGAGTIEVEVGGAKGGNGLWQGDNGLGAPGGVVKARVFVTTGTLYVFVSETGATASGLAGGGGGSSDIRTNFTMPVGSNGQDKAFLDAFLNNASLYSRIIVGGGGGGSHGGTYGHWGDTTQSPGAGGPNKTFTNTLGGNDAGHVDAGASVTEAGQDGGSSVSSTYTGPGRFGMGGQASSGSQYAVYGPVGQFTGMTWPNGGSGTRYANGGGGGGWYGGAGNWPNGGGGSNYADKLSTVLANLGAANNGAGYVKITLL